MSINIRQQWNVERGTLSEMDKATNLRERKTILLVEDDRIVAMAEAHTLKHFGYEVIIVNSGEDAVMIAQHDKTIRLILMDIDLGRGIDGTETARRILAVRNIPIVFLTSHSEQETVEKVRGITSYGYIIKNSGDFVLESSIEMALRLFEAHEKSRESEERYRRLAEDMPVYISAFLPDGTLTYVNTAMADMAAMRPEEMIGLNIFKIISSNHGNSIMRQLQSLTPDSPIRLNEELMFTDPYGTKCWQQWTIRAFFNKNGRILSYQAVGQEITERKRSEEELRRIREKLETILLSSPLAILSIDQSGHIMSWNKGAEKMFGWTQEETLGRTCPSVPDSEMGEYYEMVSHALSGGSAKGIVRYRKKKDKGFVEASISYSPLIDVTGKVTGIVAILEDITERRLAEEKVKTLLREKELLLKEVHHRIKNNMNTMMSLLSLQSNMVNEASAAESLLAARGRLQSMEVLYDKLYRADNMQEMTVREYLSPLIDEIVTIYPLKPGVTIEKKIDDFKLDVKQMSLLGIIVNELLTNAMKHAFSGRTGGLITITASYADNRATFIIQDNGKGISGSDNFESFAGFGLQLVDMLTQQLGGTLQIGRSKGTKFVLSFET